jgi:anti-sigma28 factor (negative regulator of flagellin synthesis)
MKIDPNLLGLPQSNPTGAGRTSSRVDQLYGARSEESSRAHQTETPAHDPGDDNVQLSSLSYQLRVEDPNSIESNARLEELSRLVASGRYNVDSREVSRRIVDDSITG